METVTHSGQDLQIDYITLYKRAFPIVAAWVSKRSGAFEDARDIFHDALVVYMEKVNDGDASILSGEAYVAGIAKHLWIRKFKLDHLLTSLDLAERSITLPDDCLPIPDLNVMLNILETSGRKCLDLLRLFYFQKWSLSAISATLGYRNPRSATVQKYKCIEKLRTTIQQKSMTYEDFFE